MIEIDNLTKTYGDFTLNLSLSLAEGRVTGLVGRNGAGKSTAIKAMLGLIKPDSGSVRVFGKEAMKLSSKDRECIGAAFSDSGFSSYLTINDIVKILKNMFGSFDAARFEEYCRKASLPKDRRLRDFSTGMNACLRVIIACCHNARLLILDEPTAGLDVVARNEVLDLLRRYLEEDPKRSVLISSHISSDLEGICDDIYMIHKGKIIVHEDTDVIMSEYGLLKLSSADFENLDRRCITAVKKESYGYSCLTNRRQFYAENYPDAVIESGSIDDLIIMMSEGEK